MDAALFEALCTRAGLRFGVYANRLGVVATQPRLAMRRLDNVALYRRVSPTTRSRVGNGRSSMPVTVKHATIHERPAASAAFGDRLHQQRGRAIRRFASKLATAKAVFRSRGTSGVVSACHEKLAAWLAPLEGRLRHAFEGWRQREHWWVGLIVNLRGGKITV